MEHPIPTATPTRTHPIEVLTQEALSASEAGHWDRVVTLYQRRSVEFVLSELSPAVVKRLIPVDIKIQERARIVQAATKQNLDEVQMRRRKLHQWRQRTLHSNQTGSRFTKSV